MKLLRIKLENFRAVHSKELDFAESGITLIEGPNEVGKSSIPEALDLILSAKASANTAQVRSIRPVARDADPHVEVEIELGPNRFTYAKTWGKSKSTHATTLTVTAGEVGSYAGDEAHDKARSLFDRYVDMELWEALRQGQLSAFDQPTFAAADTLHEALADLSEVDHSDHSSLMARIREEFDHWFTPGGQLRSAWLAHRTRAQSAARDVQSAEQQLGEVDELIERHAASTAALESHAHAISEAEAELAEAQSADQLVESVRQRQREVAQGQQLARLEESQARDALERRNELLQAAAASRAAADAAREVERLASERLEDFEGQGSDDPDDDHELERLRSETAAADARLATWRAQKEVENLSQRLERATAASQRVSEYGAAVHAESLDETAVKRIDEAAQQLAIALETAKLGAASVRIEPQGDATVLVDGREVTETEQSELLDTTVIDVPSLVRVIIEPEQARAHSRERVHDAQSALDLLLAEHALDTVAQAHERLAKRRENQQLHERALNDRDRALDGESADDLAGRLTALRHEAEGADPSLSESELVTLQKEARDRYSAAMDDTTQRRRTAELRRARRQELADAAIEAKVRRESADEALQRAEAALSAARSTEADDRLHAALAETELAVQEIDAELASLDAELGSLDAELVADRLEASSARLDALRRREREERDTLHTLAGMLENVGSDGRQDKLEAARAELVQAEEEWRLIESRADAAKLLHETFVRRADEAKRRYVEPFREQLVRLAKIALGDDVDLVVDDDLSIASCRRAHVSVPYRDLSAGTKEQLALLSRVAAAQVVARSSTGVPVILDDTLANSDPRRLRDMAAALAVASRDLPSQIIVLTCDGSRFASVPTNRRHSLARDIEA